MQFWKPKYSVCKECGVHFDPVTGYETRWGDLCSMHRKPAKERDQKKDAVLCWASENWERLEKIMEEEKEQREREWRELLHMRSGICSGIDNGHLVRSGE